MTTEFAQPDDLTPPSDEPHQQVVVRRSRFLRRRPFLAFVGRRFVALVVLLIGITFVAFVLTNVVPGDPAAANLGSQAAADPEAVAAFNERYGLDKPLPVQYVTYLGNLLHGDLGTSQQTTPAPVTRRPRGVRPGDARAGATAMLVGVVVGVALGVFAAFRRDRPADQVLRVVSLGGRVDADVLARARRAVRLLLPLGWFPGGGRLAPGRSPPPHVTGMYTVDALLAGDWARSATRSST